MRENKKGKESPPTKVAKLGLVLVAKTTSRNFTHLLRIADSALDKPVEVYVYLLHEGVRGADHKAWNKMVDRGLKLFACAYSARQRNVPLCEPATWVGLTLLNDLLVECDRVLTFP